MLIIVISIIKSNSKTQTFPFTNISSKFCLHYFSHFIQGSVSFCVQVQDQGNLFSFSGNNSSRKQWGTIVNLVLHHLCYSLQWHHMRIIVFQITANFDCLLNILFGLTSKNTSKDPHYWPFVRGIHCWAVDSPHKWPVTWKMLMMDIWVTMCIMAYMPWFTNNQCRTIKDIEYQADKYIVLLEWVLITLMQLLAIVHFLYWWALQYVDGGKYGTIEGQYNAV